MCKIFLFFPFLVAFRYFEIYHFLYCSLSCVIFLSIFPCLFISLPFIVPIPLSASLLHFSPQIKLQIRYLFWFPLIIQLQSDYRKIFNIYSSSLLLPSKLYFLYYLSFVYLLIFADISFLRLLHCF